jgi:hypothetical protein
MGMDGMARRAGAAVALALLAAAAAGPASAADDPVRAAERQEIAALTDRYIYGLDNQDADIYLSTVTADAEIVQVTGTARGSAEIRKMIDDLRVSRRKPMADGTPQPPRQHIVTNDYLEFTGPATAIHRAYWMTVMGMGGNYQVANLGRYEDKLVKQNGRWLFSSRHIINAVPLPPADAPTPPR